MLHSLSSEVIHEEQTKWDSYLLFTENLHSVILVLFSYFYSFYWYFELTFFTFMFTVVI